MVMKRMIRRLFSGYYPLALFFIFTTILIYTPSFIIYNAGQSSGVTYEFYSYSIVVIFCCVVLLLSLLVNRFFPKASRILNLTSNPVALYLFVTVIFFPVQGGVLDGRDVGISRADVLLHGAIFIICILISGISIYRPSLNSFYNKIIVILGIFTLCASIYMASYVISPSKDDDLYAQWQASSVLGAKDNIIIICFDGLQQDFARSYFENNPKAEELFDGFSFFTNTASAAPRTQLSVGALLRGELFSGKTDVINPDDNLINDMLSLGYRISASYLVYSRAGGVYNSIAMPVNYVETVDKKIAALFFLGVNRYLPFTFKSQLQKEFGGTSKLQAREGYKALIDLLHVDSNVDKRLIWLHTMQTHFPVRFTEDGSFSFNLTSDDVGGEIADAFSMTVDLINKLKALNAYEDSLVLLISDHGFGGLGGMRTMKREQAYLLYPASGNDKIYLPLGFYQPLIMIKPPRASGKLSYNNMAVTLLDIRATLNECFSPGSSHKFGGLNMLNNDNRRTQRTVPAFIFNGSEYTFAGQETTDKWQPGELNLPLHENYTVERLPTIKDLQLLQAALERYHADHGAYPVSEGFDGLYTSWGQSGKDWITGLVPEYLAELPKDPRGSQDPAYQYLYRSDGKDYKLIAHNGMGTAMVAVAHPELIDPVRAASAYGYWTTGAEQW